MAPGAAEIAHGPMFLGTAVNVFLYGISVTQTYLYLTSSKSDRWFIKYFVYFLFIADTVHTAFTLIYIYDSLIKNFGNVGHLQTADWIFATDPALTGIIGGTVQAFFAWRVNVLTHNIFLSLLILLCSVVSLWLGSSCAADVVITSTMVLYLRKHRTGFSQTDHQIDRIIRVTMHTGLATALWALIDLLLYLSSPSGKHLFFNFCLSKLYTNSLMSSLNSRGGWRYSDDSEAASSLDRKRSAANIRGQSGPVRRPEVFVHVESHEMVNPALKVDQRIYEDMTSNFDVESKRSLGRV
ncbi:hypothetical protein P691DRAFT_770220 [Macrolepiota fuliginosa MF-IS2]|uniref:DUF6534 domain-containing protein n=1 Tax=Macrolepiota fuliginosa MF-IS2 TaxID=1400762 RepID=A0A9P5XPR1_9AGAR|nr:hypothetical protein P691DRAFT_770220 [Macrolepiota fuliginosa MF-IS2]